MGEYYIATLLDSAGRITRAVNPTHYGASERLGPHSRDATPFLTAVETLLALDGGSRLVWAGDYADNEPGHDTNLYWAIQDHQFVRFEGLVDTEIGIEANTPRPTVPPARYRYVCNADRHEYFDKLTLAIDHHNERRNILPALTSHGSTGAGPWARDHIYLTDSHPDPTWKRVPSSRWN